MENLFCPWRENYTNNHNKNNKNGCPFCLQIEEDNDEKYFIITRLESMIIMLNKHPYNAGHLLIVPKKHTANLYDLQKNEQEELIKLTSECTKVLKSILKTNGFNIGINLGKEAGGSIPQHLHMHILPRWQGDTTFMPLLAETKVISGNMHKIYKIFKDKFSKIII